MGDWASLLLGLGVGGAVGALAAVVSAAGRVAASFAGFSSLLKAYLNQQNSPEAAQLREAFGEVESSVGGLFDSATRLRRALRWR